MSTQRLCHSFLLLPSTFLRGEGSGVLQFIQLSDEHLGCSNLLLLHIILQREILGFFFSLWRCVFKVNLSGIDCSKSKCFCKLFSILLTFCVSTSNVRECLFFDSLSNKMCTIILESFASSCMKGRKGRGPSTTWEIFGDQAQK